MEHAARSVVLILGLLCASPLCAQVQQADGVFRVGVLSFNPRSVPTFVAFEDRLRGLGYMEGEDLVLEFRSAEGKVDRLPELAAELAGLPVDVLVAPGPEAVLRAASRATGTIPIVTMAVNYDPVAGDYAASLARPGGNVTGVFFMQSALMAKRLSLLQEAMHGLTRVFALWDGSSAEQLRATEAAARTLGLKLASMELTDPPYDFDRVMAEAAASDAEALMVLSSPVFYRQRVEVAEAALKHRLPTMFWFRVYVEAGGLMAYGPSIDDMYRQGADYVSRILEGASPAELPIEQPTAFELVINLETANELGMEIPPSILLRADELIE